MNINIKRNLSIIISLALIITSSLAMPVYTVSADYTIHEEKSTQIISSGITCENTLRFMASGWQNINVTTVDLTNPYVKLDLLTSSQGISTRADVKTMAEASGAVSAINADFFDMTASSQASYALGLAIKAGKIASSSYYENASKDKLATFSADELKQVLYSYVKQKITLIAPNSNKISVSAINKVSSTYKSPVVFNSLWDKYSIGSTEKFPNMTEMVVSNGVVTELRLAMPPVEIPSDGYVVTARQEGGKFLADNFRVGDSVQLDIKTTPDLSNQTLAVSGGTMLVKNGSCVPLTHDIPGSNPRSGIGTSADGRYLYMVTVDGRQAISKGVTLQEFAKVMLKIGAYNAINFDGGGSTTMVNRLLGTSSLKVVNSPSQTPLRKVINSLGVFSTAPKGSLKGILIDPADTNIFVSTPREFTVRGYDEFYNPVYINPEEISWEVTGVKGAFDKNILTPEQVGKGTVTAAAGNISGSTSINVLSSPVEISIAPRTVKTSVGKQITFSINGKDKNGYSAPINPPNLSWTLRSPIGEFKGNTFTATAPGSSIISCSIGSVTAFGSISVSTEISSIIQSCEESTASFKGYPAQVAGNVELSAEQKHSGSSSYKLSYDFTGTDASRAAYIVFPEKSILLNENTTAIGVWVYNPSPKSEWLKAQLIDSEGLVHLLDLTRDLSWTGWKFIKVPLSEEIAKPAYLSRIYAVQIEPEIKSTGEIYIDDISISSKKIDDIPDSSIPENIVLSDPAEKNVPFKSDSNSFRFTVSGNINPAKTLLDKIYSDKLMQKLKNEAEVYTLAGKIDDSFYKSLGKNTVRTSSGCSSFGYKNSAFLVLDDTAGSIRKTNPDQWKWFLNKLEQIKEDNIFILLTKSLLDDEFSDYYEGKLFKKILAEYREKTNKNVYVISGGKNNTVRMEQGVRYISTPGILSNNPDMLTSLDNTKYILITVKGKDITYEIKKVF